VATFTRLKSGSWRVQVRRKGKYVNNTFLRRKDAEEWALETERRIDRGEPKKFQWSARWLQPVETRSSAGACSRYCVQRAPGAIADDPLASSRHGLNEELLVPGHGFKRQMLASLVRSGLQDHASCNASKA